jgi:hypothetical protein
MNAAIKSHVEQYNLGAILSDALLAIETKSDKVKKGLFGKDETVVIDAVLTPRWLVWAVKDGKGDISVLSVRLADIVVTDYAKSKMAQLVQDTGVEVTGTFTGLSLEGPGTMFIGLGNEPAAKKFQDALIKAVQDVKK